MARKQSIFFSLNDRRIGYVQRSNLKRNVYRSEYLVRRLKCEQVYVGHLGCVNTVVWNDSGDVLLSGSDDCELKLYKLYSMKPVHSITSGHQANIFSAKFLPFSNDTKIASCSGDGILHYNDINTPSCYGKNPFHCHRGTTYEVNTTPGDPNSFMTSGEDGTIRLFDLRTKTKCVCSGCKKDVLINAGNAITSFSVNPLQANYVSIGCDNSMLEVYDRRMMSIGEHLCDNKVRQGLLYRLRPKSLEKQDCRVTSLKYSSNGENLLASYSSGYVYLLDAKPNNKECLSSFTTEDDGGPCLSSDNDPPMKRLRLRGDWSDTGPNARPEGEDHVSSDDNFEQRMSGYFTQWIEESIRNVREERRHRRRHSGRRHHGDDELERERHEQDVTTDEKDFAADVVGNYGDDEMAKNTLHEAENNRNEKSAVNNDSLRHNAAVTIQKFFRIHKKEKNVVKPAEPLVYWKFEKVYRGHRNTRTMIKEANFWGDDFILSGSDCGRIFVWSKKTADVVMLLEGDRHVVNCVQPHPFLPILATSGIDYDIKMWTPLSANVSYLNNIQEVISRNERMLRESRDTVTVPASFMIRLLSSLHQVHFHGGNETPSTEDDDS